MSHRTFRNAELEPLFLLAAMLLLGGCSLPGVGPTPEVEDRTGGDAAEARQLVEDWVRAVQVPEGDRGYSLLYPTYREDIFGTLDEYLAALRQSDPFELEWTLGRVDLRDGEHRVQVQVPGALDGIPVPIAEWGVVTFPAEGSGPEAPGEVVVRLDPSGRRGIQGLG